VFSVALNYWNERSSEANVLSTPARG